MKNKIEEAVEKLKEVRAAIETISQEELGKLAKGGIPYGDANPSSPSCDCDAGCNCDRRIDHLWDEISLLWRAIFNHEEGHFPKFKSTEQLKRAIKVLGLEDEYEVVPQRIYASDGKFEREELILRVRE